jgi:uncharacterized protein YgiM (DUF1202 family)
MNKVISLLLVFVLAACLDIPDAAIPATMPPSPQDTPTATDPGPNLCTVTAEALHVRSGAGVSFAVVGYLKAGDIVTIQNQRGAWLDTGAGWIHSKYCEVKK